MIQSVWKNLTGLQKAAEHLWCDFKWATNSSPNTNDLYIHYMDKSTGAPSLEEKKALSNRGNKDGNITFYFHLCCNSFEMTVPIWIIISLLFLSYTQRHCHVRIEKSSVQTVAIKLQFTRISLYA